MKVIFLGTGTSYGVPNIGCDCEVCTSTDTRDKRLRSSIMVTVDDKNILIDIGPDFRQQMLRENIRHIEAILITHEHKDHIAGIDEIRSYNYLMHKPLDLYAEARVVDDIHHTFGYIFNNGNYPGVPKINLCTIDSQPFDIQGVTITPIRIFHNKLPIFGYRIQNLTYITDAKTIPSQEMQKIYGTKTLIINGLQKKQHPSHLSIYEAIDIAQKINAEQTYFTHCSHGLGKHEDVDKLLPKGMHIAYDGLKIDIP